MHHVPLRALLQALRRAQDGRDLQSAGWLSFGLGPPRVSASDVGHLRCRESPRAAFALFHRRLPRARQLALLRLPLLLCDKGSDFLLGSLLRARVQGGCRSRVKLVVVADIVAADEQLLVAVAMFALHNRHELVEMRHGEVFVLHYAHLGSLDLRLVRMYLLFDCTLDLHDLLVREARFLQRRL